MTIQYPLWIPGPILARAPTFISKPSSSGYPRGPRLPTPHLHYGLKWFQSFKVKILVGGISEPDRLLYQVSPQGSHRDPTQISRVDLGQENARGGAGEGVRRQLRPSVLPGDSRCSPALPTAVGAAQWVPASTNWQRPETSMMATSIPFQESFWVPFYTQDKV